MYECLHGRNCEMHENAVKTPQLTLSFKISASFPRGFAGTILATGPRVEKRGFTKKLVPHIAGVWHCGLSCVQWKHLPPLTVVTVTVMRCKTETLREAEHSSGSATTFWLLLLLHVTLWWVRFYLRSRSHDDVTNGRLCLRGNIS